MLPPGLFFDLLQKQDIEFFAGVPDSILGPFCAYVTEHSSKGNHIICANEGAAIGVAIGYHLATNKIALVYMQNSGLGNAANPLIALADREVYSIPILLLLGWRGEPGGKDEPEHIKQGRITMAMLEALEIPYEVITGAAEVASNAVRKGVRYMKENTAPFALVVRRGTFDSYTPRGVGEPSFSLTREDAIKLVLDSLDVDDIVVSTTGMISREVFEYREKLSQGHSRDFLVIGGMGHASQIALGIAARKSDRRVVCLDGDGAIIMHMGSLAINGIQKCDNFIHIVMNNGAHGSTGGQPTVGFDIDFAGVAKAVGYKTVLRSETREETALRLALLKKNKGPSFLEIRVNMYYRKDLGRPTLSPLESKQAFMEFLK